MRVYCYSVCSLSYPSSFQCPPDARRDPRLRLQIWSPSLSLSYLIGQGHFFSHFYTSAAENTFEGRVPIYQWRLYFHLSFKLNMLFSCMSYLNKVETRIQLWNSFFQCSQRNLEYSFSFRHEEQVHWGYMLRYITLKDCAPHLSQWLNTILPGKQQHGQRDKQMDFHESVSFTVSYSCSCPASFTLLSIR